MTQVRIWWDEGVTHISRVDPDDEVGAPWVCLPIEVDDDLLVEYEEAKQAFYEAQHAITSKHGDSPYNENYHAEWDAFMAANPVEDDDDDPEADALWAEYLDAEDERRGT